MTRRRRSAALALALLVPCLASAAPEDERDAVKPPEPEVVLPPYPKDQDLFLLDESRTGMRYWIDPASISIGEDRVVRYTGVLRTPGGAVNVAYEGINCATVEKRVYAFGQQGGVWTRSKDSAWKRIEKTRQDHYRFLLYDQYFCAFNLPVKTPAEAMRALRNGGTADYLGNRIRDLSF